MTPKHITLTGVCEEFNEEEGLSQIIIDISEEVCAEMTKKEEQEEQENRITILSIVAAVS